MYKKRDSRAKLLFSQSETCCVIAVLIDVAVVVAYALYLLRYQDDDGDKNEV